MLSCSASAFALEAAHPFSGRDVAEIVSGALIKEGAADEVRVQIDGVREGDIIAEAQGANVTASVDDVHFDRARNRWDATLYMKADGKNLAPAKITGRYDEMARVPQLKSRMQSGDIISESDIVWDEVPVTHFRKNIITDAKALIGKSPKRTVSAGRPVRMDEITGPTVISKGSQVSLIFKTPNIEIKTLGEALENGAQGTVIRVRNSASKAIIQGTVEGEGIVRIGSPDMQSAGAM